MALNRVQTSFDEAAERLTRDIEGALKAVGGPAATPPTFERFTPSVEVGRRFLGVTMDGMMFAVEVKCLGPA